MRVLLISNPNSTSQNAALFREVLPIIRGVEGLRLLTQFTHYPGHAEEMVRGMTRADYDVILAFGGDGTVNEIVNGLLGPVDAESRPSPQDIPALAVIPTGSANVFVRALGFPNTPIEAAHVLARMLDRDIRREVFLGTWNDRWFAVNAGFGLDADVLARVDRAREKGFSATPLRYLAVSFQAYQRARIRPPRINVRAVSRSGDTFKADNVPLMFTSNTNPWTFLGPLPVVTNPRNSFDQGLGLFGVSDLHGIDGLVGVLHLFGVDRRHWLNKVTDARTLHFEDAAEVDLECPKPHRFQADGESEGTFTTIHIESVPNALEVFAPIDPRPASQRTIREVLRDFIRIK
ncbi:diacylglycerol/lipid kinase family protein [Corynebacterium minutissimum]|uniref:Lipid kinase n=1 Tax=Corynebacterium minutissimum TaxID=38301 RepID=A0A2X4R9A5_9CORY|nr:diacylglycerol kinase family protein [Corynebacterium minutissimum]KHO28657.1 diacylglycerol kinase [Corynebacterium minutissimum]MCG7229843.1 diacylglycerol kinase family lipid kinase [Corynebacterium minutissimum]MCG7238834.1 diacylglycerol kinase family lipid kinase [Corynebacterium minutissimum]QPS59623.1 diacylglycerol kinase family lipid kinase [Corynebacterium minutissimum]QQA79587.1 diacylglycerol kinase family lipid kinase [Corynebacterium minutissimum]